MRHQKLFLISIFFITLIFRLFYVYHHPDYPLTNNPDAIKYNKLALNLVSNKGYVLNSSPTSFMPPFYSLSLALIYFFTKKFWIIFVIQSLIDSMSCILTYFICKKLFNYTIAILSSILYSIYIEFIKYCSELMSETLFIFLLLLTISLIIIAIDKKSYIFTLLSGIFLGLSALTKPLILPLPFLLCLFFKKKYKMYAILLLSFLITLLPWSIRNYIVHRDFVLISTHGGISFFMTNNELAKGLWVPPQKWNKRMINSIKKSKSFKQLKTETEIDKFFYKKGLEYIMNSNLKDILELFALKLFYLFLPFFEWDKYYQVWIGGLIPFMIVGLIKMNKNSILYYPILNLLIITIIFCAHTRIKVAFLPFLNIFAVYGLEFIYNRIKNKYFLIIIFTMWGLLNIILYLLFRF